ncbi:phage tail assembly protein [Rhodoplanes tepidamans]|uniref:Phage tail assembly protein n=1 Tax=Rhodoplanes tepidamans TaxID=200616 RepID=A0ABT5JCI0_RHOTP|nr:phage tail assembly protein [Rhodoplanes tepidamans]MDC7787374.1 phage tail assembly protein [Rhodoplanes tepidamans]
MSDDLPSPIDVERSLTPVAPPPGSPDHARRSGASAPAGAAPATQTPAPAAARPLPAERLAFKGRAREEVIALDWPFERDGNVVETITVRRLTVAEVAEVVDSGALAEHGLWAVWAAQAGLTVGELRGLDEDDGGRVTEACNRFLPRVFAATLAGTADAATSSGPTSATGAPMSGS